jgi:hypothetical protein
MLSFRTMTVSVMTAAAPSFARRGAWQLACAGHCLGMKQGESSEAN